MDFKDYPNVRILETNGKTTIRMCQYMDDPDTRPIQIPEGITEIGSNAFMSAHTIAVKLPKSLKSIATMAFKDCENLELVEMQEGVETIDSLAFAECPKLMTVKLPSTIRNVYQNAFADTVSLYSGSKITLYLTGEAAQYIVAHKRWENLPAVIAAGFVIDGKQYDTLESYVEK